MVVKKILEGLIETRVNTRVQERLHGIKGKVKKFLAQTILAQVELKGLRHLLPDVI